MRLDPETVAYDAVSTLQEWLDGYKTLEDGQQYRLAVVDRDGDELIVEATSGPRMRVDEERFIISVDVRRTE